MEVGLPWEFHGKCPMGWDGTAGIAFAMRPMEQKLISTKLKFAK